LRGVIWLNGVRLAEIQKPPLRRGEVLGKVLASSINHIEKLITLGFLPTDVGRILGSVGLIKAIDVGVGLNSNIIGRYFLLLPRPGRTGGINFDGVLAELTSIPYELLIPISKYYASALEVLIYAELSYVYDIVKHVKNKDVLVLGCGPTSYVIVKYIKDICNAYVACLYNQQMRSKIAELGVHIANYENLSRSDYDVIIVLTISGYPTTKILKHIKNTGTIIIPPTVPRALINLMGFDNNISSAKLVIPNYVITDKVFKYLNIVYKELKNLVGFVRDFEEGLNSMFYFWRTIIYRKEEE